MLSSFQAVSKAFKHRVMSFDETAVHCYGILMAKRKKLGRPLSHPDGQIAAIAHINSALLVTRNTKDFLDCDLELINPF
jgi:predicted nucleic acid-binding protein